MEACTECLLKNMARPRKIGLDYFPMDVKFDEKIEAIELLHGNNGLVWVLKFWQSAYQTELGEIQLDGLFGELHANKCRITTEEHYKILNTAITVDFCYKTESCLYTSNGIKKRISAVSTERNSAIERKRDGDSKVKDSIVKETPHCSPNNTRTIKNNEEIKEKNWKTCFEIYKKEITEAYNKFINDKTWIESSKHLYPNIDIKLSVEKGFKNFWGTEAGWERYKKKKIEKPDYKRCLINSIDINKVYFKKQYDSTVESYTPDYHKPFSSKRYEDEDIDPEAADDIKKITDDLSKKFSI